MIYQSKNIIESLNLNKLIHLRYNSLIIKPYLSLIKKETSWLSKDVKLLERIFCIINNIFEPIKCLHCNKKEVKYKYGLNGYQIYCSINCLVDSDGRKKSYKKTWNNKSQDEKDEKAKQISIFQKEFQKKLTPKQKIKRNIKISEGLKNLTPKQRAERSKKQSNAAKNRTQEQKLKIYIKKLKIMEKNGTDRGYSKPSQELFWKIYEQLSEELQKYTYFAELNEEFKKLYKYKYDFVIKNIKICIEYNGEVFHPNPNMTEEEWNNWNTPFKKNKMNADEKYAYDQTKLDILRKMDYKVLEVWHSEYLENPNKVLKYCLNFIN